MRIDRLFLSFLFRFAFSLSSTDLTLGGIRLVTQTLDTLDILRIGLDRAVNFVRLVWCRSLDLGLERRSRSFSLGFDGGFRTRTSLALLFLSLEKARYPVLALRYWLDIGWRVGSDLAYLLGDGIAVESYC